MTTTFDLGRPPADELLRLLRDERQNVRRWLRQAASDPHQAVHEARRAIRRGRSLLRLLRGTLDRDALASLDHPWRVAGAQLSRLRDAQSVLEALDGLVRRVPEAVPAATSTALRRRLLQRRQRMLRRYRYAIGQADAALADADHGATESIVRARWRSLVRALADTYRRGRQAHARMQAEPEDEEVRHRFRRRTRDHYLQLERFIALCPAVIEAQAQNAKKLAQALGRERDLALLAAVLARLRRPIAEIETVNHVIAVQRRALLVEVQERSTWVYAERPGALGRRFEAYLTALSADT